MGGHISQKWYEFTTGDQEIDRFGWVYRLVIENVVRLSISGWDCRSLWLRLSIANWDGWSLWSKRLNIKTVDCYGLKKDWCLKAIVQRLTIRSEESGQQADNSWNLTWRIKFTSSCFASTIVLRWLQLQRDIYFSISFFSLATWLRLSCYFHATFLRLSCYFLAT